MVAVRQQVTERDLSKGMARANSRRYARQSGRLAWRPMPPRTVILLRSVRQGLLMLAGAVHAAYAFA
jgi:hypothetical protein